MLRLADPPLQIAVVPLIAPVGRAFTLTVALPLRSPLTAVQLASLNVATVYEVVADGDTLTLIGLVVPLNV